MNVPDLRNVDFDAYRQRAADLRAEAIDSMLDRAAAYLRSLLSPRPGQESGGRAPATPCTA
jgi:hypothetical protein